MFIRAMALENHSEIMQHNMESMQILKSDLFFVLHLLCNFGHVLPSLSLTPIICKVGTIKINCFHVVILYIKGDNIIKMFIMELLKVNYILVGFNTKVRSR